MIQRLAWDSDFFGYEVGKIEIENITNFNFDAFKNEAKKFRLVYVFSDLELNILNFELVDKKVVFYQEIKQVSEISEVIVESFDKKKHNFAQLEKLALDSGIHSRFFVDKNFKNNEYLKLYSRWIESSVNRTISFDVLVALNNDEIIGFTTLNKKSESLSDIGLVAVLEASRGFGIGKKIINESIRKAREAGFSEIQVVTQLTNIAAVNLYEATNFKKQKVTNIYHFWNT
jgi:dTDP-4-amino-4,6-dideoxy-D-galactose acyltransferase